VSTLTFPALTEIEGKITERRKQLANIFAEAGETVDLSKVKAYTSKDDALAAIRNINAELADLGNEQRDLAEIKKASEHAEKAGAVESGGDPVAVKDGQYEPVLKQFYADGLHADRKGSEGTLDVDVKTLMTTAAGWAPETNRSGLVVEIATRPIQVVDVFPQMNWDQAAYVYMEETTFTNNSAEAAEGGTYAESAFVLTERTQAHSKVAHFVPVTDEQLEDVPEARAYLEGRLTFGLRQRVDSQLLVGNGTTPNMRGVNNVAGIQTQAKGADPAFDAILKGATKVKTTGQAMPGFYITNPTDWQTVRLTRTVDGIYILGNPNEPGPTSIWGLRVVEAQAQTLGTGVVGDFTNFSLLVWKRGIVVKVSDSHSTFFVEGKQAMRADVRGTPVWLRPAAFCTITGL
jgi:Phage capsid family